MIASHRGLQSLGRVLTIGVSCCLFTSLVMLPALLAWITRHRSESTEDEGNRNDTDSTAGPGKPRDRGRMNPDDTHPGTSTNAMPNPRYHHKFAEQHLSDRNKGRGAVYLYWSDNRLLAPLHTMRREW